MKVVFPIAWLGAFSLLTILLFTQPANFWHGGSGPPPATVRWQVLAMTLGAGAFFYWLSFPLKRVEIDDKALYVSNYREEIVVPLREIESVTENRWINIHPVTVHLYGETAFGGKIVFMPKSRWFMTIFAHPIVAELLSAAARARGTEPGLPAA
jgi:hypothetical protein